MESIYIDAINRAIDVAAQKQQRVQFEDFQVKIETIEGGFVQVTVKRDSRQRCFDRFVTYIKGNHLSGGGFGTNKPIADNWQIVFKP